MYLCKFLHEAIIYFRYYIHEFLKNALVLAHLTFTQMKFFYAMIPLMEVSSPILCEDSIP